MRGGKREGAGRTPGTPNKSNLEIKAIVQETVDFTELITKLNEKALGGDSACAKLLLEYGFGRPSQTIDLNIPTQPRLPQYFENNGEGQS